MKAQVSYPFTMLEAAFTFTLIMSIAYGSQAYTTNFVAEETADIRADRVENAATVLHTYESGSIELDISSYEVKTVGSDFYLRFDETEEIRDLTDIGYSGFDGPNDYEDFSSVCLEKNLDEELIVEESC